MPVNRPTGKKETFKTRGPSGVFGGFAPWPLDKTSLDLPRPQLPWNKCMRRASSRKANGINNCEGWMLTRNWDLLKKRQKSKKSLKGPRERLKIENDHKSKTRGSVSKKRSHESHSRGTAIMPGFAVWSLSFDVRLASIWTFSFRF